MNRKSRILVVDDTPSVISLVRSILEAEGYEVFVATGSAQCFEKLPLVLPDLVLLDVMMRGCDGYSVCERLKSDPATGELPVLFLSALASGSDKARGFEAGGEDYIVKPVDPLELKARVKVHLRAAELRALERDLNEELERRVAEQTAEIRSALEEREGLLREINHRIMNNLQVLISLIQQQMGSAKADTRRALEAIQARAGAMALIYRTLTEGESISRVKIGPFIESLIAERVQDLGGTGRVFSCELCELELPIESAMPFGVLASELITNALVHAYPAAGAPALNVPALGGGEIRIRLEAGDGRGMLAVEDDGIGFRPVAEDGTERLGLHLVNLLARQLGGACVLESSGGTRARFEFPL
jgi:two-component sensor histidine kinase